MLGIDLQNRLNDINVILRTPLRKYIETELTRGTRSARYAKLVGYYDAAYMIGQLYQQHNNQLKGVLELIKPCIMDLPFQERSLVLDRLRSCEVKQIVDVFTFE